MPEKNNILNILRSERILLTGCNYVSHFFKKKKSFFVAWAIGSVKILLTEKEDIHQEVICVSPGTKLWRCHCSNVSWLATIAEVFVSGFEVQQSVHNWPLKHHNILFRTLAHIAIKVSHYQTIDCHRITLVHSNRVHTVDSQVNHPTDSICDSDWLAFW